MFSCWNMSFMFISAELFSWFLTHPSLVSSTGMGRKQKCYVARQMLSSACEDVFVSFPWLTSHAGRLSQGLWCGYRISSRSSLVLSVSGNKSVCCNSNIRGQSVDVTFNADSLTHSGATHNFGSVNGILLPNEELLQTALCLRIVSWIVDQSLL